MMSNRISDDLDSKLDNSDKNEVATDVVLGESEQLGWDNRSRDQEEDELLGRSDETHDHNHDLSYEANSNETTSLNEFHTAVECINDPEEGMLTFLRMLKIL
ncbi:unnamed protein product [Heterobilharzia americana]|nr:unnamed protein product [Heterobilharzia americana]